MIPSLLQIPSAVSDSKLHSVLPNNGKGDFQFERSTGATRINRDGLIEEVGYFSSELVQNGNFSELGSELVVNGSFESNSDWTNFGTPTTSEQSTNKAYIGNYSWHIIGTAFRQGIFSPNNFSLVNGKTYKASLWIYAVDGVEIQSGVTNSDAGVFTSRAVTQGEWTNVVYYFTANASSASYISILTSSSTLEFYVDNVSIKQVDPNDRWTLSSGWSYGANKVIGSATNTFDNVAQNNLSISGKQLKLTFDIVDYTSGTFRLFPTTRQDGLDERYSGNGSYQVIYTSTVDSLQLQQQNFVGGITNISLVEVQGDRPRLSYDITNGVVEDTPHLLLENSSTNLLNFSEPTSSETLASGVTYEDFSWHLGFTNCIRFGDNSQTRYRYFSGTISNSTEYVISAFVIMDDLSEPVLGTNTTTGDFRLRVGGESATTGNLPNVNMGNNIYRVSSKITSGTSGGTTGLLKYTSQSNKGFRIVGFQLEQQSYATSYIPTAGTTITRAAETCNNSKPSVNSTEGVLYAEIASLTTEGTGATRLSVNDGSQDNNVTIGYSASNTVRIIIRSSASNQALITSTQTITDFLKIAVKYKANDFALYINGSLIGTDTSGSAPSGMNDISFDKGDGTLDWYGKIKGLAVYNEALSESQLMQLTGVTASSIYNNFVTRTASFTVEALNEVKKVIDNL